MHTHMPVTYSNRINEDDTINEEKDPLWTKKKHHRTWLESCSVRVLQRQTNELVNFQLGCYYSSRLYGVGCVYKVQKRDQTSVENSE